MARLSLELVREALSVASALLPAYAKQFGRQNFTPPQLSAILVPQVLEGRLRRCLRPAGQQ